MGEATKRLRHCDGSENRFDTQRMERTWPHESTMRGIRVSYLLYMYIYLCIYVVAAFTSHFLSLFKSSIVFLRRTSSEHLQKRKGGKI